MKKFTGNTTLTINNSRTGVKIVDDLKKIISSERPCPYCGSINIVKNGTRNNGIKRFKCKCCDRSFTSVTGTIFDKTKITLIAWVVIVKNMIRNKSIQNTIDELESMNEFLSSKTIMEAEQSILDAISMLPKEPLQGAVEIVQNSTFSLSKIFASEKLGDKCDNIVDEHELKETTPTNSIFSEYETIEDMFLSQVIHPNDLAKSEAEPSEIDDEIIESCINDIADDIENTITEFDNEDYFSLWKKAENRARYIYTFQDERGICSIIVLDYKSTLKERVDIIKENLNNCEVLFGSDSLETTMLLANNHILHIPVGTLRFYFDFIKKSNDTELFDIVKTHNSTYDDEEIKATITLLKKKFRKLGNRLVSIDFINMLNMVKRGIKPENIEKWATWFAYINNKFYKNKHYLIFIDKPEAIKVLEDIYFYQTKRTL